MADGRHLKKPLNHHISANFLSILMKFGMLAQIKPLQGADRYNFQFFKKQDGGGSHLEKPQLEKPQKSRYDNNGLADLREIWHDYAKWDS